MKAKVKIDKRYLATILQAQADDGLEAVAEKVANRARELAPVRKVFAGQKTPKDRGRVGHGSELRPMRRAAAMIGYRLRPFSKRTYFKSSRGSWLEGALKPVPARGGRYGHRLITPQRRIRDTEAQTASRQMIRLGGRGYSYQGSEQLSARGRYELRSGRAIIKVGGVHERSQLGGGLKHSISADEIRPGLYEVRANVPYAKYVEFGTRHATAQPFLLPAFKAVRNSFKKSIADAVGGRVK